MCNSHGGKQQKRQRPEGVDQDDQMNDPLKWMTVHRWTWGSLYKYNIHEVTGQWPYGKNSIMK